MVLKKILLTPCFSLLFLFPLLAEEAPSFDLGEIVITKDSGTAFANSSTTTVSSQDIEIKSAQTVDEALDFIPGVRVTVGQKNEPYVMVRGFNQDKVLILLDGIPIASPNYGYVDLDQIPVESISKIKIIKSAVSVLYGANTLGGVINIVTKKPGKKPCLEIDNGFSEHNTHYHILSYAASSADASVWFSGSNRKSDGFRLSDKFQAKRNENGGYRENSFYDKNVFSLKLGLEKYERHDLSILFNYIDNDKGIPPDASGSSPKYWRFTEWKRQMIALADDFKISDNFSVKGRIYYDKYDNTLKAYDDASYTTQIRSSSWTSIYDDYALGSSIYLNFNPHDKHSLKGAINFKTDVHKEQDDTDEPWETYGIHTYSFGLEDEFRLGEKLSLLTGASFNLFDQIKTATGQKGKNIDSFNPLFAVSYFLTPKTTIYSSVSKRTCFPTMQQLYSQTSGNPDLKEQRNTSFELGLKHNSEKIKIESSCFYNDVKNLIDRASKNDPYLNLSKAVFEGLETGIQAKIGKFISVRLSYTYVDARDKNPTLIGRSEKELPYVPKHKTDLEVKYLADFGFSCSLLGSYSGKRYYYDSSNIQHALGGYFVWNTRFSQQFLKHWEAAISIENVFDRNYQEEEGYPQPGRTILFSIKGIF